MQVIAQSNDRQGDQEPTLRASLWQVLNTIPVFVGLMIAMYLSLSISYFITLLLSIIAAGFMVRIFIIQHDCGHGSFFRSRKWNDHLGQLCSLFTLVPYYYWRREHALHHASSGNLDQRGHGDMDVFTVTEYLQLSRWERIRYRAYRNPVVFLLLGPVALFLFINRFVFDKQQTSKRDRRSVYTTNIAMAVIFTVLSLWLGISAVLMIALPVIWLSGGAGIWLFYIQHQFERTYWKRGEEWNYAHAAMQGSSFYRLPRVLQWITGNIGYHHIHHLNERIPNYRLQALYERTPEYRDVYTVTLRSSLQTMFLSVWDEEQDRLISFRELRRRLNASGAVLQ